MRQIMAKEKVAIIYDYEISTLLKCSRIIRVYMNVCNYFYRTFTPLNG